MKKVVHFKTVKLEGHKSRCHNDGINLNFIYGLVPFGELKISHFINDCCVLLLIIITPTTAAAAIDEVVQFLGFAPIPNPLGLNLDPDWYF